VRGYSFTRSPVHSFTVLSPHETDLSRLRKTHRELETRIEELRFAQDDTAVDISDEIAKLTKKSQGLTADIYAKLTAWQISQVARHPQRPYTLDYINNIFSGFEEMHGDRNFGDDPAIVGGVARFNEQSVVVIGHQKGRDTKERTWRNFGMPKPEGYRKALRLMKLAEKFNLPLFTFIDTPGAYPGVEAEERGQSEAIGRNLYAMAELRTPIISTCDWRGRFGRRTCDCGGRCDADAAIFHLFGDFPRRLCSDLVEKRRQGSRGRRNARYHCDPPEGAGACRQSRE
jgi:acetyl-CoA carboxylase carboxyl transferase alpha subunit